MMPKKKFTKIGNYVYNPEGEALGEGSYGAIYKGAEITNKENKVAIKIINKHILNSHKALMATFSREIKVLKRIKGKHLLEYKDSFMSTQGNLYIITKFYKDGDLSNFLVKSGGKLPYEKALKILNLIAKTFVGLEKVLKNEKGEAETIIHRDLKPANILMDGEEPVIADFGFAKFVAEGKKSEISKHTGGIGTVAYMSPQLLAEDNYSFKCDVWSMGIVTYEMIYGIRPWKGDFAYTLSEAIRKEPLTFPEEPKVPTYVKDLIKRMLEREESARYDWNQIVKTLENKI